MAEPEAPHSDFSVDRGHLVLFLLIISCLGHRGRRFDLCLAGNVFQPLDLLALPGLVLSTLRLLGLFILLLQQLLPLLLEWQARMLHEFLLKNA